MIGILLGLAGCNLTAEAPIPFPTPDLPIVTFIYPENGSLVFENVDLNVDIYARDTSRGIARIEFFVDGEQVNQGAPESGVVPEFRVTMNWFAEGLGGHTLAAIAYRADGTASDQAIIAIDVIAR